MLSGQHMSSIYHWFGLHPGEAIPVLPPKNWILTEQGATIISGDKWKSNIMEKDGDSLNEHQENIGKTNDSLYFLLKLSILFYPMSNCWVHFGSNTNIFGVYLKFSHTIEY